MRNQLRLGSHMFLFSCYKSTETPGGGTPGVLTLQLGLSYNKISLTVYGAP